MTGFTLGEGVGLVDAQVVVGRFEVFRANSVSLLR